MICTWYAFTMGVVAVYASSASAELSYGPVLPQFGGTNGQALGVLQYEAQLEASAASKAKADQAAVDRELALSLKKDPTATDRLISSLTSALQVRLANSYADQIFATNDTNQPVSIKLDGTDITYSRVNGLLTVSIEDGVNATTVFELQLD